MTHSLLNTTIGTINITSLQPVYVFHLVDSAFLSFVASSLLETATVIISLLAIHHCVCFACCRYSMSNIPNILSVGSLLEGQPRPLMK